MYWLLSFASMSEQGEAVGSIPRGADIFSSPIWSCDTDGESNMSL